MLIDDCVTAKFNGKTVQILLGCSVFSTSASFVALYWGIPHMFFSFPSFYIGLQIISKSKRSPNVSRHAHAAGPLYVRPWVADSGKRFSWEAITSEARLQTAAIAPNSFISFLFLCLCGVPWSGACAFEYCPFRAPSWRHLPCWTCQSCNRDEKENQLPCAQCKTSWHGAEHLLA